ncbi:hypothetical protein [Diplocloster modestus]|uniref:Uncharacterized protein n=1 Tax=Diplocloster modestus TaxID=2850322 RepID=A0ABS6K4Z1_9FIRM|nr:hypothetical protein [Diplocloster modestus]MBU9725587.1 hypothetical protein [Diplocloster modestus]
MAILKNAITPELIPSYDGSNQTTHPSVLYFPDGFQGYEYWMAMTPYPFNDGGYEDPSVLVSRDGRSWQEPVGVTNPLVPRPAVGHNCDVELCYEPKLKELRLYYVEADDIRRSWVKLLRSRDGSHWEGPQVVLEDPGQMYSILSPAIQQRKDGSWQMWYVDSGNTGFENQNNKVRSRISLDGLLWGEETTCNDLAQPGHQIWHISVWRDPATDVLHAFYPAYPDGTNCDYCSLFYARKDPGQDWETYSDAVLDPGPKGAWDDFCIYRASFLLDEPGDKLKLWYGGKKKSDSSWNMGLVETSYTDLRRQLRTKIVT